MAIQRRSFRDPVFGTGARWSKKPGWTGPGFSSCCDGVGGPGRLSDWSVKRASIRRDMRLQFLQMLAKVRVDSAPERIAREMQLLVEGACVLILIHGDRSYAETAARIAKLLLQNNGQRPAPQVQPRSQIRAGRRVPSRLAPVSS